MLLKKNISSHASLLELSSWSLFRFADRVSKFLHATNLSGGLGNEAARIAVAQYYTLCERTCTCMYGRWHLYMLIDCIRNPILPPHAVLYSYVRVSKYMRQCSHGENRQRRAKYTKALRQNDNLFIQRSVQVPMSRRVES